MKITVKGDAVSPERIAEAMCSLENEYGLKIRDLTMYVRFIDGRGRVVDPKLPDGEEELILTISEERKSQQFTKPLSLEQLVDLLELHISRPLIKSEMEKVIVWVNEYQITYEDYKYVLDRQIGTKFDFRTLDRWFLLLYRSRKEKEILNR